MIRHRETYLCWTSYLTQLYYSVPRDDSGNTSPSGGGTSFLIREPFAQFPISAPDFSSFESSSITLQLPRSKNIVVVQRKSQFTFDNNVSSSAAEITCDVPQGSVLGPLLFLDCVNDIANAVPNQKVRLFADDTNLFLAWRTIQSHLLLMYLITCVRQS